MSGTDKLITLDRLRVVLDAYGAKADRWPAEERAGAIALIESADEARMLFEEAAALDDVLDTTAEPTVSPVLVRRVRRIETPPRYRRVASLLAAIGGWLPPRSRFGWQSAVAAATVVGLVAGIRVSEFVLDDDVTPPRPAAAVESAPPVILITGNGTASDSSLTLEQDVSVLSLTGSDGTGNGTAYDGEDSGFSVASMPLY